MASPYFFLDILYSHEPPSNKNYCQVSYSRNVIHTFTLRGRGRVSISQQQAGIVYYQDVPACISSPCVLLLIIFGKILGNGNTLFGNASVLRHGYGLL